MHADVKGMIKNRSVCDASYLAIIVGEYSRFVHATPICNKSKVSDQVPAFVRWYERQSGQPIRSFHSDCGVDFFQALKALKANAVEVRELTPYTPQSDGLSEQHVGTALTAARAALQQINLVIGYWDQAVQHVAL